MRVRSPVRPHPFYLVEESNMKRGCEATESDDLGPNKKPRRRQVTLTTLKKWQVQLEREHQTMTWLRCDTDQNNPTVVNTLWRNASRMNEAKKIGMKTYSSAWINGSTNRKTSCAVDHANSDQHRAAVNYVRKASGTNHHHVYIYVYPCIMQVYSQYFNYYEIVIIINIIDVRPCWNKTSVGLTHCQINL